jgi:hypothetical protein
MRTRTVWTLFAAVLLLLALAVSPVTHAGLPPLALAQGDDGEIEPADDPDDEDATLEPGQGDEFPIGDQGPPPPVEPAEPFHVEVLCAFTPEAGATECAFTGMPPAGYAEPVTFLVPVELACAAVIGGQYDYVTPDPAIGLYGFRPVEPEPWLTLQLDGVVTPAGAATYWFLTREGIVPATGPALACAPAPEPPPPPPTPSPTPRPTPSPTPAPTTGTLLVRTLTCAALPEDRAGYDWFGECEPLAYRLGPAGMQVTPPPVPESPAEAVFAEVPPGTYDLEALGFTWCHAISDNVTPESAVVIEAGERTTVWIFLCGGS